MQKKKHTISLDIGTASVGWAVLEDFSLARAKRKITTIDGTNTTTKRLKTNLWGVRLFDTAATAEERRVKRGQRRRVLRRTQRLRLLRSEFFKDPISAFDPQFFNRLQESFLQTQNTAGHYVAKHEYPLFNNIPGAGETYTNEKDYYKQYPTIYHLRHRLISDPSQADLRLVYLAIHHILKYRGHFVNQGQTFDMGNIHVADSLKELLDAMGVSTTEEDLQAADTVLMDRTASKSKKAEGLEALYGKPFRPLFNAIVGNGIDIGKIFNKPDDYNPKENTDIPKPGDFKYSL
ncbi:MAG: hypothetical protein FWG38_09035, partial [Defluviitaleaceae bacterium]|nr:hypothetical protein [Defluviitaleaceae bacterium]